MRTSPEAQRSPQLALNGLGRNGEIETASVASSLDLPPPSHSTRGLTAYEDLLLLLAPPSLQRRPRTSLSNLLGTRLTIWHLQLLPQLSRAMTLTIPPLPLEIVESILDLVCPVQVLRWRLRERGFGDLQSLSLVSRFWNDQAQRRLMRTTSVHGETSMGIAQGFLRKAKPASYVRELKVSCRAKMTAEETTQPQDYQVSKRSFFSLLHQFPYVTSIDLNNPRFDLGTADLPALQAAVEPCPRPRQPSASPHDHNLRGGPHSHHSISYPAS